MKCFNEVITSPVLDELARKDALLKEACGLIKLALNDDHGLEDLDDMDNFLSKPEIKKLMEKKK